MVGGLERAQGGRAHISRRIVVWIGPSNRRLLLSARGVSAGESAVFPVGLPVVFLELRSRLKEGRNLMSELV